jgi:hypothetical protein
MDQSFKTRRVATYLLTVFVAGIGFARAFADGVPTHPTKFLWLTVSVLIITGLVYVLLRHFLLADPPAPPRVDDPADQCGRIAGEIDVLVEQLQAKVVGLEREGRFQAAELTRFDSGQLRTLADRLRGVSRRLREPVDEEAA